jgi:acyl-CoA thioester hydrolase
MRFFEQHHGVFFDDLDAFQILHNSRYVLLFERSVGQFWRHLGWTGMFSNDHPDQFHLVRANTTEYLRPVEGVGDVRVRLHVSRMGRTSLTFAFRVLPMDEDVDFATGTRTIVRVDPKTRKPLPWTEGVRAKLRPYVEKEEP